MSADVGDETALGYTLGLAFPLPIFERGQAERARASAARRAAEADTRWLETQVPAAVTLRVCELCSGDLGDRQGQLGVVAILESPGRRQAGKRKNPL